MSKDRGEELEVEGVKVREMTNLQLDTLIHKLMAAQNQANRVATIALQGQMTAAVLVNVVKYEIDRRENTLSISRILPK